MGASIFYADIGSAATIERRFPTSYYLVPTVPDTNINPFPSICNYQPRSQVSSPGSPDTFTINYNKTDSAMKITIKHSGNAFNRDPKIELDVDIKQVNDTLNISYNPTKTTQQCEITNACGTDSFHISMYYDANDRSSKFMCTVGKNLDWVSHPTLVYYTKKVQPILESNRVLSKTDIVNQQLSFKNIVCPASNLSKLE